MYPIQATIQPASPTASHLPIQLIQPTNSAQTSLVGPSQLIQPPIQPTAKPNSGSQFSEPTNKQPTVGELAQPRS